MNLRVLVYSNPLTVDKISKRFLFQKDSGFIFTKNLLSVLPNDWRYCWLIPENITEEEKQWFRIKPNMELIAYPYSTGIHQNRYNFSLATLVKNFPYTKDIDIVLNNQPEVSANIKTWLENQRREKTPIFNFFHWIDCYESRKFGEDLGGYFWREYDGVLSAEKSYFHNEYAHSLFDGMVKRYIKLISNYNYGYFMPPATEYGKDHFVISEADHPWDEKEDKKVILFNHRLNETTNWKFFLQACDRLYEKRQDFMVWFTDDSDKAKSKTLARPYVINRSLPDNEYGYLLLRSHFAVCTHKGYSTYNMAILDTLNALCFTIMPQTEEIYLKMFGMEYPELYHQNDFYLVDKMNVLLDVPARNLRASAARIKSAFPQYFTTDHLKDIEKDIVNSITKRVQESGVPAKYDEVVKLILHNTGITKAEIVNGLWAYHVNSNFQHIRWRLLMNGIEDDTSKEVPTYR
jgi:glycosyltransferase involved in cell wall biosynthesis